MANSMIDFKKKYHYSKEDVDAAHELVFVRLKSLRREVERFNETVEQALWIERHRNEIRKLEMSDGSFIRGEEAENASAATVSFDALIASAPVKKATQNLKLNNPIESYAPIYNDTFEEAKTLIDKYIYFYNHQRIQLKTGVAPLTLRHSA